MSDHVDVLVIGAGLSGIGVACRLSRQCPDKTYALLERRTTIGGTWDLFRYPGVRSDSDMYTFGYSFRPWLDTRVLADGPSIRDYVEQTAAEYGVVDQIRFGQKVTSASWSSADQRWTVEATDEASGETQRITADVLVPCTGYYNYDTGYRPDFPGEQRFTGRLVHPQHWPADLDYTGKSVVIIGSGATAVTLVPAMAEDAAHVTMLQRSPTYIVSLPARDKIAEAMLRVLPEGVVYKLARTRNIAVQRAIYALARARPNVVRDFVLTSASKQLGGMSDLANFTPKYNPWDQRLCVVPDGDLFAAIRSGAADVVTDRITTFTETGIELESGARLDADIIVTATGLDVQIFGGMSVEIDGEPFVANHKLTYKGVLVEDLPNAALIFGYTNASWTLKADIAAVYLCRLINHMDAHGYRTFVARGADAERADGSILGSLNAGYVRRGNDRLPRQGVRGPWKVRNDYLRDAPALTRGRIEDRVLRFDEPRMARRATPSPARRATA
ncbi:flavin-containing monooxygenase [uncultured Jatrophihabitans sp.]|uniref:flavin-containing monooxygenase n=1 Tax=uncultured Jatrophihabitans sp. TaxID=1610747 RepID=UPI0035CABD9B